MRFIGLTGGMASGKSTVAKMLKQLGAKVLDADAIYHALLLPVAGKPSALAQKIADHFPDVLLSTGDIDRQALRTHVYQDAVKKRWLEDLTHPAIGLEVQKQLLQLPDEVIFYDVPLLFEKQLENNFSAVVLVFVPYDIQLQRLIQRDHITVEEAEKRLQQQMPLEEKLKRATYVIDNSQSFKTTEDQVKALWQNLGA